MTFPPLPAHLLSIITVNRHSGRALELRDDLWKHFENFLAGKGYVMAWDGDDMTSPDLPPASNPFAPTPGEAFSAATAGREGIKWGGPRANPFLMGAYDHLRRFVVVKIMSSSSGELSILQRFTAPAARRDPQNHTIPVLEYINAGDWTFVVMPAWELSFNDCIPISRPAEFVAVAVQCLQGLEYMHKQNIAHLDIYPSNILCNHVTNRPARPFLRSFDFRLAYIDFEFSKYVSGAPGAPPSLDVRHLPPTYLSLPEIKAKSKHVNPFSADVYALGRTLMEHIRAQINYERLHMAVEPTSRLIPQRYLKLMEWMTTDDPTERPSVTEALAEAQGIIARL